MDELNYCVTVKLSHIDAKGIERIVNSIAVAGDGASQHMLDAFANFLAVNGYTELAKEIEAMEGE